MGMGNRYCPSCNRYVSPKSAFHLRGFVGLVVLTPVAIVLLKFVTVLMPFLAPFMLIVLGIAWVANIHYWVKNRNRCPVCNVRTRKRM